ncbi:IS66 family insertion sequence element accessory protein TnpB [Mycoplasmatota bacterium]|nr:IS66 family insertion sequence element accessory protein TnpB [Mycoplasmatota bacterium]QVK19419.1 IS66 family insertion sequence element accessory protein TnpB [Mycoplasmatota bacterium]
MIKLKDVKTVYFATGYTDLRKSIDGLSLIVKKQFDLDPFSNNLFVFCNKSRQILKILHWDYNGFWIYKKRLESGKFNWPKSEQEITSSSLKEFYWFLDGYEIRNGKAFKEVKQRGIV